MHKRVTRSISKKKTVSSNVVVHHGKPFNPKKIDVLKLTCEKLKFEIDIIKQNKDVLEAERKNISLHTEVLKLKHEQLAKELFLMKREKRQITQPTPATVQKPQSNKLETNEPKISQSDKIDNEIRTQKSPSPIEILDESPTESNEQKLVCFETNGVKQVIVEIPPEKSTEKSSNGDKLPYIILSKSTSPDSTRLKRKQVYVRKLYNNQINQYFEITNENPLKIQPLNQDVPMAISVYKHILKIIRKTFLIGFTGVPEITICDGNEMEQIVRKNEQSEKETEDVIIQSPDPVENVIDLTENDAEKILVDKNNKDSLANNLTPAKRKISELYHQCDAAKKEQILKALMTKNKDYFPNLSELDNLVNSSPTVCVSETNTDNNSNINGIVHNEDVIEIN